MRLRMTERNVHTWKNLLHLICHQPDKAPFHGLLNVCVRSIEVHLCVSKVCRCLFVCVGLLFQRRETEKLFCGPTRGAAEWSLVIGSVYLHKPGFVIRSAARRDTEHSQTHFNSHKMSNQHHPSLLRSCVQSPGPPIALDELGSSSYQKNVWCWCYFCKQTHKNKAYLGYSRLSAYCLLTL